MIGGRLQRGDDRSITRVKRKAATAWAPSAGRPRARARLGGAGGRRARVSWECRHGSDHHAGERGVEEPAGTRPPQTPTTPACTADCTPASRAAHTGAIEVVLSRRGSASDTDPSDLRRARSANVRRDRVDEPRWMFAATIDANVHRRPAGNHGWTFAATIDANVQRRPHHHRGWTFACTRSDCPPSTRPPSPPFSTPTSSRSTAATDSI